MERPVQFVSDVNDKKDFWKLVVKVKDKWTVVKAGKEHLEMVIVDAQVIQILQIYKTFIIIAYSITVLLLSFIGK